MPAHFDNPTAAATSFVKERGCDPSKAKAKKQEASGWLEDVKNVGKSVYNYLSESASHWGSKALHPTGVGDFLYSGANWLTYGLVNGVVQGYKDRNDTMWQNPSTYNIINWASSGLLDTAKGTFAPEKPLSGEHWLNSASFALVLYGGYTAAKNISSTAPANTISTPHPSSGTGMLDDFADEGAGGAKVISETDKIKIDNWKYTPDDSLYLKYKDVYDNPKYFNQTTGDVIYPGMNGDINIDGFVNGKYTIETLQPGKIIDRYGSNGNGKFFSPNGTSYGERALPPFMELEPYTQYRILQPIDVKSGAIAPWFNQAGNGTQFLSNYSVEELIKLGIIEKVR